MPESRDQPRRLNLSLSSDYLAKPMMRVGDWLEKNTNSLRALAEAQIVQRVRAGLGSEVSVLSDSDIAAQVRAWASNHGFRLVSPPPVSPMGGESEIVRRLKRLFGSMPGAVQYTGNQGSATISVSGLTATMNAGKVQVAISRGWNGEVQFKTQAPGAVFTASLSPDKWSLTLTIGRLAPSIADLETVFRKGEAALRGVLAEAGKIDWRDPSKTKQQFSPYLDPIKAAVDAASKTAAQRPGDVSLGAWLQGGVPGAPESAPRGVTAGIRLTVLF
jgi:hypothetical protein